MSNFWELDDKTDKIDGTGNFDSNAGFELIPNNTQVNAVIDEAKIDGYEGDDYVSWRWTVLAPEQYKNRKIFQKVRVFDPDGKKRDKAKKMFGAVAFNAGGELLKEQDPTREDLMQRHLLNKPMALLLKVWKIEDEQTGEKKEGNWVSAVSPINGQLGKPAESKTMDAAPPEPEFDDDIPF